MLRPLLPWYDTLELMTRKVPQTSVTGLLVYVDLCAGDCEFGVVGVLMLLEFGLFVYWGLVGGRGVEVLKISFYFIDLF